MFAFDLIWLIFTGLAGAFPFDYVSMVLMGANYSGYLSVGLNPMSVVLLMVVGLFVGLLARSTNLLRSMRASNGDVTSGMFGALFVAGLISLVCYMLLGKLGYSLSLDNRYIGIGMLCNAILILVGSMVKRGRKETDSIKVQDGLFIGAASLLAFFPGASFLAALFVLLRLRGYSYRAVGEISIFALMINVLTYIFAYFILFPGYFDFNGSLVLGLMIIIVSAVTGFLSTFGYDFILQNKLPKVLALLSFAAGILLVFF